MTQGRETRAANAQSRAGFLGWPSLIVLLLGVIAAHWSFCAFLISGTKRISHLRLVIFPDRQTHTVSVPVESHPPLVYL